MALRGPFMPKGYSEVHPPEPKPLTAVEGEPALKGGELTEALGLPEAQPVTIHIDGENLLDIIVELRGRISELEDV